MRLEGGPRPSGGNRLVPPCRSLGEVRLDVQLETRQELRREPVAQFFARGQARSRPAFDEAQLLDDCPVLRHAGLAVGEALGDPIVDAPCRDDLDAQVGHALDGHLHGPAQRLLEQEEVRLQDAARREPHVERGQPDLPLRGLAGHPCREENVEAAHAALVLGPGRGFAHQFAVEELGLRHRLGKGQELRLRHQAVLCG